jgi:two-component system NtrC family sensor kinase
MNQISLKSKETERVKIPLFWKFTIGMVVVVVLFGSINVALVHRIIFSSLEEELQEKGVFMSQIISERAINYILFDDIVALNVLLDEVKAADESIEYILVCDIDCRIKAHTFDGLVPDGLHDIHQREQSNEVISAHVKFQGSDKLIRDISIPLLEGNIGFLRVGLTEDNIGRTLNQATRTLLGMILTLVVISLGGTFVFSYLVTSPVKDISNIADNLDMQSIREKKLMSATRYPRRVEKVMKLLPGDEIDILVSRFNEMVQRLQKAYDELEITQKKLIQSEKLASIGTLASGVAHEVNNPLAGIMHCISRIKKNPGNTVEAAKYLDLMEEAAIKMEMVVKNLLDFARQPDHQKNDLDPKEALQNSLTLAKHRLEKEKIKVFLNSCPYNVLILGNKNQLEQVFLNLVLNSIDAIADRKRQNPEISGELNVSCGLMENDKEKFFIELKDNGSGIPSENLTKIYDPFFTTKPPGKGTGLGLSVSMNIIGDHGGEMEIQSVKNSGTIVSIILPVKSFKST